QAAGRGSLSRANRTAPDPYDPTANRPDPEIPIRHRPKFNSLLVPILWSTETGSEAVQRIAVRMIGGMVTSSVLTPVVIPASCAVVKGYGKQHWETDG
ncbi:MAG: hypothetical protein AB7G08_33095, partial [Hyphomicrobiaceae bacterium]